MIRKVHLDFHTHPDTTAIGRDFDADAFAETLAAARVNYLATPGKCHFGNIYYDSKVGHAHPHLEDPEMFPRTVAACLERGIKTQAYWTLGLDAHVARDRPGWRQRFIGGTYGTWGHYHHMCFASPYVEHVVIPEVLECIDRCPGLAGFWFDISLYVDGAFYSPDFDDLADERLGEKAEDRTARWWLAREIVRERCIEIDTAIQNALPGAENYFNSLVVPGEPQNIALQPVQEVENPILFHGPERMTTNVRWLRGHGAETVGLVSRFQGPWSDPGTLRTPDQMCFDVARTIALGCHVSMGDHRYPDGSLEPEVYGRLAPLYAAVEALEPWLDDARPCREAVLLAPVVSGTGKGLLFPDLSPLTQHAARVLEEIGVQFDVISTESELPPDAGLVIWPGEESGSVELMARLERHVAGGGTLLAQGAALDSPDAEQFLGVRRRAWSARPGQEPGVGDMAGIGHVGAAAVRSGVGPVEHFVRLVPALGGEPFSQVLTRETRLIDAAAGVETLAELYAPVSSKPPFPSREPVGPAIVQNGNVVYSAADLFGEAAETGAPGPSCIVAALCDRLLPDRMVSHDAGPTVAAHLHQTRAGYALHLVHWAIDRWADRINTAAQFPTLAGIEVRVGVDALISRVALLPEDEDLPFTVTDGLCVFTVPSLHVAQVIALELETLAEALA